MISYSQVKCAITPPPPKHLVDLFNELNESITAHPKCVNDKNPFEQLIENKRFCISATSIQSNYIAFVLGKHCSSEFPAEIIKMFFDIDSKYKLQFGEIPGDQIDGCICLIHQQEEDYDLQKTYFDIYE
ncbi:MAG TPA: hypothetical protein ENK52_06975 [Saprospiraceae bacterium]|nr:hypothetical protein [Saprospiraceae bacterium]